MEFMRGVWMPHRTAGVGEDPLEYVGELGVAVRDQIADCGAGVVEIHDEVSGELGDPVGCRVGGGAQDADAAGCMLDHGEDVLSLAGQGDGPDEVAGQQRVRLGA